MAGNIVWNEDWDKVAVPAQGYHRYSPKYGKYHIKVACSC